jgi:hypothetical protein
MAHKAPDTQDDEEFTFQGVTNVIQSMGKMKASAEVETPNEM